MTQKTFALVDNNDVDQELLNADRKRFALQFEREKTALKFYLIGKGYHDAIKALGFIEREEHKIPQEERFRKDKRTPSLHHQIRIALSITQLKDLDNKVEQQCIINSLLHDVQEDRGVTQEVITSWFGKRTADINWKLTKKFAGEHKNKQEYIKDISLDMWASLCKGEDRCDNLNHMIGVFSLDKIEDYSNEAETVFLPMIKTASKLYPELFQAYTSISLRMKQAIKFARQYVKQTRYLESVLRSNKKLVDDANSLYKQQNDKLIMESNSLSEYIKSNHSPQEYLLISNENIELKQRLQQALFYNKKDLFVKLAIPFIKSNGNVITQKFTSDLLATIGVHLELSTLEIITFLDDKFSEGTSVNLKASYVP